MGLSFLAPAYLWTLALIPLVWLLPHRATALRPVLIRSCVLLFLALGLARPVLLSTSEAPRHVVILDRSASLSDADAGGARTAAERILAALPGKASTRLIDLAPSLRRTESERFDSDEISALSGEATSISSALLLAARSIAEGSPGAVTLISDGMATDRHWGDAIAELVERKIPLHTVIIDPPAGDPRPVALSFPPSLRVGHTAAARVGIAGAGATVRVVLRDGDHTLASRDAVALTGACQVVLEFEPTQAGFRNYEVVLEVTEGSDAVPDDNSLARLVPVQDPLRVLYLGHRIQGSGAAVAGLLGAGFEVEEADTAEAPPEGDAYDVVMIDDRPASELSDAWQRAIVQAVRERGAGLFASGGRAAFGSGGYSETPIEEVLPVELLQKEEKKDPSTTLAIIIDTSGSMVGNRMTLAKQVARLAMRRLQPHDKVGIVEFYGTKQWAAPIQSAANQIDLQRALNRLGAEGGTVLLPAVEEAYYALKNVQTRYKHVLILTDAGVETGPYEAVVRRMSDEGMTVSTVLVGPGRHSEFLVELADWGRGRYYNASDRFNLPELLLKRPSTSVLPAYRPERVQLEGGAGAGWWGDLDPAEIPPLDAFVESELRPGAERLISTRDSRKPVLASWAQGLGRVTAFMSEPVGPGTRSWSKWEGYGSLLGRVISRTARGAQDPFEFSVERRGAVVRVRARRTVHESLVPVVNAVSEEGLEEGALRLDEIAPGHFASTRSWPPDEPLRLVGRVEGKSAFQRRFASGAASDVAPETQVDPRQRFPMAVASGVTGGRSQGIGDAELRTPASPGRAPASVTRAWPWLLLASLLFYIADVFLRRRARNTGELA